MRLSATRKSFDKCAPGYVRLYRQAQLAEALSDADYVILCVRAGDENKRLFDARMLAAMKSGLGNCAPRVVVGSAITHGGDGGPAIRAQLFAPSGLSVPTARFRLLPGRAWLGAGATAVQPSIRN